MTLPIEQQILNDQGYLIVASSSPRVMGEIIDAHVYRLGDLAHRPLGGPIVIAADATRDEFMRQSATYGGSLEFGKEYAHFYKAVAE